MSKAFFSLIGDELYSIKNSPFQRIGSEGNIQKPMRESQGLAFDPDRLFNPDKYKQKQEGLDEEYVEFKKKQDEELAKIQYDLLKKNTNQEYQKKLSKMQEMRRHDHKHPYSWFGVYRGMCLSCDKCGQYEGFFNHSHEEDIQLMQCIKCHCPMNSHIAITGKNPYRDAIWKHLKKHEIKDEYLNVNYNIFAFKARPENVHEYGIIIDILSQFGCEVLDSKVLTKLKFELGLIRQKLISEGVEKIYLQYVLNLIQCLQGQQQWKWKTGEMQINEHERNLYQTIKKTALSLKLNLGQQDKVVVMLVKCSLSSKQNIKRVVRTLNKEFKVFEYCWGSSTNKQSLIGCQIFFSQYFSVKYEIFLLPSSRESNHNSERFKDILDYNRVILMMENLKNVNRMVFQKTFRQFNTHKINYILGEQILSENIKRVGFKLTAKIGKPKFVIPFDSAPDFINISQPKYISRALRNLYPEYCYSQRCVLIIRPFAISSNFQEVIVNLLRINKFILIKRIKVKLDESEAKYLATLQKIDQNKLSEYVQFMTTGVCEIVLVSKRSAIYEAHALTVGCETGPTEIRSTSLKEKPVLELKRGKEMYEYDIPFNIDNGKGRQQIFNGLNSSISIEKTLFGSYSPSTFATNSSTGQIIKVEGDKIHEGETLKISNKMREAMLKELKSDPFNYWVFTSKSQTITEELTGFFLPQQTLFHPVTLVVKPGFTHLISQIKNALLQHKYHIITDKSIQMSKALAYQFIINCQKINLSRQTLRYIIECYATQKIHILCVSKISGRSQIISMLRQFTFLSKKNYSVEEYIDDEMLRDMLVPVWKNQELFLKIISQPLGNIFQAIKLLQTNELTKQEKFEVFNYLIGSVYGVPVEDLSLNTKLGKLSYYITDQQTPRLQSWYYSLLSSRFPNYVPLLFQYRNIQQISLCIQSDQGVPFMKMIGELYIEERQKLDEVNQQKRKSLVMFLWSKKIVELVQDLSEITTQLKDFGQIQLRNSEYRGNVTLPNAIEREQAFLRKMTKQLEIHKEIKKNIKKLQGSRHLKERYVNSNKRLLPSFTENTIHEGMRIVQNSQTSKLHLMNKYSLIDPNNEQNDYKDMYNLKLFNITPQIRTKYSFMAQFYFFFLREEFENYGQSDICIQLRQMYIDALTQIRELQILEYEIYLKLLIEYDKVNRPKMQQNQPKMEYKRQSKIQQMNEQIQLKNWIFSLLKVFPNLKKGKQIIENSQVSGKKRKYIDHKQYFVRKRQVNEEVQEIIQKKYTQYDLNKITEPMEANNIYNPNDALHQRIVNSQNKVNLLRQENPKTMKRPGMYVEFQKKISQNQQLLMTKLKKEVDKFNVHKNDQILHETGLQKQLWYRRAKGQVKQSKQSKTNLAIQKQIGKFMTFKEEEKKKISQKQLD